MHFSRSFSFAVILSILSLASVVALPVQAAPPESATIVAVKPVGPVPGTFTTAGAISDAGTFRTVRRIVSAIPAPTFLISHLTLVFEGAFGTFTVRAQITESLTADPAILLNEGRWVIVDGTGAYAALRGEGEVIGTVDETLNLITRTFRGVVHTD
jgi:hypothetical protein